MENKPLQLIDKVIFSKPRTTAEGIATEVEELFAQQSASDIPYLTRESFAKNHVQAGSLVKFRCMVQDMFEPEYFLAFTKQNTTLTAFYRDAVADENIDHEDVVIGERDVFYCVSVPGQTKWCTNALQPETTLQASVASETKKKRSRQSEEQDDEMEEAVEQAAATSSAASSTTTVAESSSKRLRTAKPEAAMQTTTSLYGEQQFPIPNDTNNIACIVKVYTDASSLKLNELVEVVGVLAEQDGTGLAEGENMFIEREEQVATHPPHSIVPRLHCISFKKLATAFPKPVPAAMSNILQVRQELVKYIASNLLGDEFAAEYALMNMLSHVYSRVQLTVLGKFNLNISKVPIQNPSFISNLMNLYQSLLPTCCFFDMSIANLTNMKFVPYKNYGSNKLISGLLQLPDQTQLIINETALSQGKLEQKALSNLQSLFDLISNQTLQYDFTYHKVSMNASIPVLVVSEGKALLNNACEAHVPLAASTTVATAQPSEEALTIFRDYIQFVKSRCDQYTIGQAVQKQVEQDFVALRKSSNIPASSLHLWLSIARLLALSKGESELSYDRWQDARDLETKRKKLLG